MQAILEATLAENLGDISICAVSIGILTRSSDEFRWTWGDALILVTPGSHELAHWNYRIKGLDFVDVFWKGAGDLS